MLVQQIVDAEAALEDVDDTTDDMDEPPNHFMKFAENQLDVLVDWVKKITHFTELPVRDQELLMRAGQ